MSSWNSKHHQLRTPLGRNHTTPNSSPSNVNSNRHHGSHRIYWHLQGHQHQAPRSRPPSVFLIKDMFTIPQSSLSGPWARSLSSRHSPRAMLWYPPSSSSCTPRSRRLSSRLYIAQHFHPRCYPRQDVRPATPSQLRPTYQHTLWHTAARDASLCCTSACASTTRGVPRTRRQRSLRTLREVQ